jgi:hypothetical protein
MPCFRGGIRLGVCGILRAGVWCAITPISPLFATVLGLELQCLTPLGILHMAAFVTLCDAYMGIEP